MTSFIKKLPAVFQTVTEKKFFDATFDQVFSKKDSDLLYGYIGQRVPGRYNPISDFYLPEPTKDRTWWQLEATAYARNEDTTKSNVFFYDDLLSHINYYGGNTLNQDRLFQSQYYSWAPPIDVDMFVNYQNYYWIEQGLQTITIAGVLASSIIGSATYTTPPTATPPNLTLTSGMNIVLESDPAYATSSFTVANAGGCDGIRLVQLYTDITAGTIFEFLPWDGQLELSNGRVVRNTTWDTLAWDVQAQPGNGDYITIERGSFDRNAWSRTNKWFHISAINATAIATGTPFPSNSSRALRPIIQFDADLILYKAGVNFRSNIKYGFNNDSIGQPLALSSYNGQPINIVNSALGINISDSDLVIFMADLSPSGFSIYPINQHIYRTNVSNIGVVTFTPVGLAPVLPDDIVFATIDAPFNGAKQGQTWYLNQLSLWTIAANDKNLTNQPPLFQLFDHNGIPLDDPITYPGSTFSGNKIFSYKINSAPGAAVDPVLKFPIVYTALGQASDIVFLNNLITDRYTYGHNYVTLDGYYYYDKSEITTVQGINISVPSNNIQNAWNLYAPCPCANVVPGDLHNCIASSKQRVIDRFVVGYGNEYQFKLSVTPYGYPSNPDLIVSVNGTEVLPAAQQINGYSFVTINKRLYIDLSAYIISLVSVTQAMAPVVQVDTYTRDTLDPAEKGYFKIPQQLDANPNQLEVTEISASNLSDQFSSIIANQTDFTGIAFGGNNNYRDSRKNRSVGKFILQNISPALKSMLIASEPDLNFIDAVRFSQDEYTKFKNRFLKTALQLINQGFNPTQYHNNTIIASSWTAEILKTINISKEFSNAFAYSYMVAAGSPFAAESRIVPVSGVVSLLNYIDLSSARNALYIYDITGVERLLTIGHDYDIVSTDLVIELQFYPNANLHAGDTVRCNLYKSALPSYIPSTPTKLGAYMTYVPRIELDTTFTIPTNIIVGHDGSRTIAFGDYRDQLLLDLETRIYNLIPEKFRRQYNPPIRLESIRSGYFRNTHYSRSEYLDITEQYLNKWATKNKANYRTNEWETFSQGTPANALWKLYNYSSAVDPAGNKLNLPGNWKGIFQYYYDTYNPGRAPWRMLGFTERPTWWVAEYGAAPYTNTSTGLHNMWADLEAGIIRQGPEAIFDPDTLIALPQPRWVRPGLSAVIPVDSAGITRTVPSIFNVALSGNLYDPFDGFDNDWVYGDMGPVEAAWVSTSGYVFSVQEFMYLMRPAAYGEQMFDTIGTEISPGFIDPGTGITGPVKSSTGGQFVQNDTYSSTDTFYAWMRPKNKNQIVHGEVIDLVPQIRFGYQAWISDKLLFLGKDVTATFGQKIRTLDVNLANKLAGFTNKDTTTIYVESSSPNAQTSNLSIPTNNFDVLLHKGQSLRTYSYSGVIIRALGDGTFVVYGYDLLNSEFNILGRANDTLIDVTVGGTPAEFRFYTVGETYTPGTIIRYNGVYYQAIATITAGKFDNNNWVKLKALPITDGISVSYKPVSSSNVTTIPYGTILTSPQAVFDMLIGWGAYLETQGWLFDGVNADTNQVSDWLYSAKQFLFWLNTNWAPDAAIQLSPLANSASIIVQAGYPDDVETISNGMYSILDKYGVAIPPNKTAINRDGRMISVTPSDLSTGGIYFLMVNTSETEHVLIFDNLTSFNDVIYDPLLRSRQQRLRFNGFRSNGWYGKMEAPGYLIMGNQLVPNFDTIVDSMRYFYDPNVTVDNPSLEDLGRHLIGYENKSYMDNLQVSDNVQYLFYQGAIRQKGTIQSFDKLFRSTKIQSNETIEVFEEWALKLGEFGNTIEQVSTEFILKPEQNSGEVIVARLNFIPSPIGSVKEVNVVNAQNTYAAIPSIIIDPPYIDLNDTRLTALPRTATAYAVMSSLNTIASIGITDPGYGYTSAPNVEIDSGFQSHALDKIYTVFQGNIIRDKTLDNIIEIDIDDTEKWISRPANPAYSLEFPVTVNINFSTPNAGYVNFKDVTYASFDVLQTVTNWGTSTFNPAELDTVWIAKTFTEDWNVYSMVNINNSPMAPAPWQIIKDDSDNLILLTNYSNTSATDNYNLLSQLTIGLGYRTDFGNLICLQIVDELQNVSAATNYTLGFISAGLYVDDTSLNTFNSYNIVALDGTPITSADLPLYDSITDLLLFKTMRFDTLPVEPLLPSYVGIGDLIWVDNLNEKWQVLKVVPKPKMWDIDRWDASVIDVWSPNYGFDVAGPLMFSPVRVQEELIDTSLFQSATVFDDITESQLVQLPVYDPFKGIMPAVAKQNISYISMQDPARYNITGDPRLYSSNIIFAEQQVGKLWWDLSDTRYVYYEQPLAQDLRETETDNLVYRRDHWGQLFPGSEVRVYEWVKSPVPPTSYKGTGIPRSGTDYVQIANINRFTNITTIDYYFWVLGVTTLPNVINRTTPALDVQRTLQVPKTQGFAFFAPIQQTDTNNSYMFYNVQEILIYKGDNIQIQYRMANREDQKHAQWMFFREGDSSSSVTDQYWNKMVDSLTAYTALLPAGLNEYDNSIIIADTLPWDIFAWDVAVWDTATSDTSPIYGEVLPVPDPSLSDAEKYGVQYRPRQSMFVNLSAARKVFVQAANALLSTLPTRDDNASWSTSITSANYWTYTTWYATGFENVIPTVAYANLGIATAAVGGGLHKTGTIIEVTNGTADRRFMIYEVVQVNPIVPTQSLNRIGIQDSSIQLLDTLYTTVNLYNLATELRQLLNVFRTQVFINSSKVYQNELFSSMLNYVISEQKTPDWVFKSSYIYIKENNLPLSQDLFYVPDQIDNIINYIIDAKPYHTQIRDYTSTYIANDIGVGTSSDTYMSKTTLMFNPELAGNPDYWDIGAWDEYGLDVSPDPMQVPNTLDGNTYLSPFVFGYNPLIGANIDQLVSDEIVYTVPVTTPDPAKKGLSNLFPYTFNFDSLNRNNPQSIDTPANVVGIRMDNVILIAGKDFYVGDNGDDTFTVYFFNDPTAALDIEALVWFDGGQIMNINFNTYRNELAYGQPADDIVINVDTKLPVNSANGVISPYVSWDSVGWEHMSGTDTAIESIIAANNGSLEIQWDALLTPILLDYTISYKQNVSQRDGSTFYRNAQRYSGTLQYDIAAPSATSENLDVISIYVDPATHLHGTDILTEPGPGSTPGVIWVDGERIEYRAKTPISANVWQLTKVRRGTLGTAAVAHFALVPSIEYPALTTTNRVWVERGNTINIGSPSLDAWSLSSQPGAPIPSTQTDVDKYTSVGPTPIGGLWYGLTPEAIFLKSEQKNLPLPYNPNISVTEILHAIETESAVAIYINVSVTEIAYATETESFTGKSINDSITDIIYATETESAVKSFNISVTEIVYATETESAITTSANMLVDGSGNTLTDQSGNPLSGT